MENNLELRVKKLEEKQEEEFNNIRLKNQFYLGVYLGFIIGIIIMGFLCITFLIN
jgi:hypothetical protein